MKNTKKILRKYLEEMAMDFDTEDRPSQDVINKLQQDKTTLSKIPFPKTDNPNQNFQEKMASSRYRTILNKFREITGNMSTMRGDQSAMTLAPILMSAVGNIENIEQTKKRELTQLAVNTALEMFGLQDSGIKIKATITGMSGQGAITKAPIKGNPNDTPNEVELEKEIEEFDLERAKRRLVNALIQGAGNISQYSSQWLRNRLENKLTEITGNRFVLNTYLVMMSTNDLVYWQMGDNQVLGFADSPAGSEEIEKDEDTGEYQIVAKGINFIVLLHELIKGLMEYVSLYERDESYSEVTDVEDTLANETWDLRLGPEIYDMYRKTFTDIIYQYEDANIELLQTYFWRNICELPARKYLVFSREILGGTAKGREMLEYFFDGLYGNLQDDDDRYQENLTKFHEILDELTDTVSDEELEQSLNDLFGDIPGIRLLSDYEKDDEV